MLDKKFYVADPDKHNLCSTVLNSKNQIDVTVPERAYNT